MKKTLILSILILSITSYGVSQVIYTDPALTAATITNGVTIRNGLKETNKELSLIEKGQLAITANLTVVNNIQDKIYKGLTEVSSALKNLTQVKATVPMGAAIIDDVEDILDLAKEDPKLALFAEKYAKQFKDRAVALGLEVATFVLKDGETSLMDAGERTAMLRHIYQELVILKTYTYLMQSSMERAKRLGFLQSINPYQGFINKDKAIATQITGKAKVLK